MATVIDALIVELGLDPKNFNKEQKKAAESVAGLDKEVERRGKSIQQNLNNVRNQVLSLMAAFLAGKGIKEFVQDMVKLEAETARTARILDTIPQELSAWRGAVTLTGGSADGLTGSIMNLTQEFQRFALTGESSVIPWFRALQVNISDVNTGKMRDFSSILLDLADKFQGMDPARATAFGRALGLDQGTINLLIQGRKAVQAMLDEQKRLGVLTREDAMAGLALQHSWLALEQSSQSLGRTLLTAFAPVLIKILDALTNLAVWVRGHQDLLRGFFIALTVAAVALGIAFSPVTVAIVLITAAVVGLSAAIALLYDDWMTFTRGGKSELGAYWDFMSRIFGLMKALVFGTGADIRKAWHELWKGMGADSESTYQGVMGFINGIGHGITAMVASTLNYLQGRLNALWNAITGHDLFKQHDFKAPPIPSGAPGSGTTSPKDAAWMAALESQKKYGVPADVTYAQWALESDYGRKVPAGSNNPFGIKAKPGQASVTASTREYLSGKMVTVDQNFAKYGSIQEAFDAHAQLLATGKAYARARAAGNSADYADALTGTYATDPAYGAKLKAIMAGKGLPHGGASVAAAAGASPSSTTITSQTKIDKVEVHTQARDAAGIARDIKPAIERDTFSTHATYAAT